MNNLDLYSIKLCPANSIEGMRKDGAEVLFYNYNGEILASLFIENCDNSITKIRELFPDLNTAIKCYERSGFTF